MTNSIWTQTIFGRKWDLLQPSNNQIDWSEIAYALSRIPRFNGHTQGPVYVVAQHCCHCYDLLDGPTAKKAALLHDAHEFVIGDLVSPVADALAALCNGSVLFGNNAFKDALRDLKARQDEAIFKAAGLPWPLPDPIASVVRQVDLAMLMTERRDLMTAPPEPWFCEDHIAPIDDLTITPWSEERARKEWLDRLQGRV